MSATDASATRSLVLWVPDWPVLAAMAAADIEAHQPAAIQEGNRITVVSAPARATGVRRGMNKRQARGLCPELELLPADESRDARAFEPVAAAVEGVVAGLEICRSGLLLASASGASRFHGSEQVLVERVVAAVTSATGYECQAGIGDGVLAAVLAARDQTIVPSGHSRPFLAPRPLAEIVHAATTPERVRELGELIDLWDRLGIRRMSDLADLPRADIEARFGWTGGWVHRLVHGEDLRPPAQRRIEGDVESSTVLDPPAYRVDVAAFAARRLAEELHGELVERTASCGRLQISAWTESGRELTRTWRTDDGALGGLTAARMTDRVRWQLEGWLSSAQPVADPIGEERGDALVRLALSAQDLVAAGVHQGRLWGQDNGARLRAQRASERVQGLLGIDAVVGVRLQGGRGLRDQVHVVPWGDEVVAERTRNAPWPGKLPEPAPANVLPEPEPVDVLDRDHRPVVIDRRLQINAEPAALRRSAGIHGIDAWTGPWPTAQRWWREDAQRSVYLQAILTDGDALLLSCSQGHWFLEAFYD